MNFLAHIADRALNTPLFITPQKASVIIGILGGRIRVDGSEMSRFVGDSLDRDDNSQAVRRMSYNRTPEGVAIITITGTLVNRGAWIGANSGATSYEGIKHQLDQAVKDPKAKAILLDIASPGGEAVGCMEIAEVIRAATKSKTVVAVVNGMACSAAYAIASAATRIVTTPTGMSGSIGVVFLHTDQSGAIEKAGIKPTLIFAGAHKVDANPFEPLSKDVRTTIQSEINAFYALFVNSVAAGRGKRMTADQVRATEARVYVGAEAVKIGLADAVGSFDSVLLELSRAPTKGRINPASTGASMSGDTNGGIAAESNGVPKADHDAAVLAARKQGAAEATTRIKAILGSDAAKGREAQAQAMAFETDMSAEAAATVLAAGPALAKASVTPSIAARVEASGANDLNLGHSQARVPSAPEKMDRKEIYGRASGRS